MLSLFLTAIAVSGASQIVAAQNSTTGNSTTGNSTTDWTQYVNPLIGTEGSVPGTGLNGGNTFPGAVVPFGAVKLGPDVTTFNDSIEANGGYLPDGNVTAFSLTHVSGTGGGPVYGVVSQMPLVSLDNVNLLDNLTYLAA
jgi:putative alpha-1,2-mannosidase